MMETRLSPNQQRAYESLQQGLQSNSIVHVHGSTGTGRTTLLKHAHAQMGGAFLSSREFLDALQSRHPLALEETFETLVLGALKQHALVFLDEFELISNVVSGCFGSYPRARLLEVAAAAIAAYLRKSGKRLVVATERSLPDSLASWAQLTHLSDLTAADYAHHSACRLEPAVAARLDYQKIHRFASYLDGHDFRKVCTALRGVPDLDTEGFIEYLRSQGLSSNVDLEEVQKVELADLKGCGDVIERLEANIVLPLEQDDLAHRLGLRPKRGVLLAGPPGTGKTTVGRALAHRLRGKFFLVDGTIISGTGSFYHQISCIFHAAKENAPSVIFIDDSDVIFEAGGDPGLYRYLLTMLDGLESESNGQVCVMLTAMDVANIPPALLRSGRIELWLEMRLPDPEARLAILEGHLRDLPAELEQPELPLLVASTEGFTGADLKRVAQDGKNLYAFDLVRGLPLRPMTEYFVAAVDGVKGNKEKYAEAEANARARREQTPPTFHLYPGMLMPADAE